MTAKVSAFWPVEVARFKYLFFIVNWSDFSNSITVSLERNLETLGQEIGLRGNVVQAYKDARQETFDEITKKEGWPYDVHARFDAEQYPFMLVIKTDFEAFSPQENTWALVWFSDFRDNPDSISEIFGSLVKQIRKDEDLFDYFQELKTKQAAKNLVGYFELKPGIFGISIDVKAIIQDVSESIQRRFSE